jgi:lysine 2,3-aminomutase
VMEDIINKPINELVDLLWKADPAIRKILAESETSASARNEVFSYLSDLERQYFNIFADFEQRSLHICERNNARECIRVLKNIIRTENEILTGFSVLITLRKLAKDPLEVRNYLTPGFITELIYLFRGINGKSGIAEEVLTFPENTQVASQIRTRKLNDYARRLDLSIKIIPKGTDQILAEDHDKMKQKILSFFKGTEHDWKSPQWQMRHIISDLKTIKALVSLTDEEIQGLQSAEENKIPFQITPYYLSLFNSSGPCPSDRAIRAQVLPGKGYCENVATNRKMEVDMDFMGEKSTSPVPGITRRYPQVVILKPIDTCPQLCVYCQRNWEVKPIEESGVSKSIVENAIRWIKDNQHITEVLITGGDPLMLTDEYLKEILESLSKISHIERIRIGTRIPVT